MQRLFQIAGLRMFGPDPFHTLVADGSAALLWLERKLRASHTSWVERAFATAGLVLLSWPPRREVILEVPRDQSEDVPVLDIAGVLHSVLVRIFGRAYDDVIRGVLDFIEGNMLALTAASVALVAGALWRRRQKSRARSADDLPSAPEL